MLNIKYKENECIEKQKSNKTKKSMRPIDEDYTQKMKGRKQPLPEKWIAWKK